MVVQIGLPERLTRIDETHRSEYPFLCREDRCLFFADFHASQGWNASPTNQLIANFKRARSQIDDNPIGQRLRRYREQAIHEISAALRGQFTRGEVDARCTFVPIPTSKSPDDPECSDRLERTLQLAFEGYRADIRPLLRQTVSTVADHLSGDGRITYEKLLEITALDPRHLRTPLRRTLVLFDDVLTTGKHYKVAKACIRQAFPEQEIVGIFVARCIHV
jgi:hypothetical protein